MLAQNVWPVSLNDHLMEPAGLWADRLPKSRAAAGPRVVDMEGGGQGWRLGSTVLPLMMFFGSTPLRADPDVPVTRIEHMSDVGHNPATRVAAMNRDKVAVHTLMPHAIGFAGERLRHLEDVGLWTESVRTYNDFQMGEVCAAAPDRLVGLAILPLGDFAACEAEIERVAGLGARGISLPHDPAPLGLDSYHKESWVRLFDAADAGGLPVFIHLGSGGHEWVAAGHPLHRPTGTMVTAANFDVLQTASDLAFSPLLRDRPDRKVILLEGNIGWSPYLEERMDFATANRRAAQAPKGRPPSQVVREQILGAFLQDPLAIRNRHEIGLHRLLWQSDFPHMDSVFPDSWEHLAAQLRDVPDDEAYAIAAGTARKLLRLAPNWTPPEE